MQKHHLRWQHVRRKSLLAKPTRTLSAKEMRVGGPASRGLVWLHSGYLVEISAWARLEPREARIFPKNLIKTSADMC